MPQIDPAIYDQILSGAQQSADLDPQIAFQQKLAEQLRQAGATPQTRMSGHRAVAPHFLEYLGAGANQAVGGMAGQKALGMQRNQSAIHQQQVQQVLQALRAMQAPQPQQQQPMTGTGYGSEF